MQTGLRASRATSALRQGCRRRRVRARAGTSAAAAARRATRTTAARQLVAGAVSTGYELDVARPVVGEPVSAVRGGLLLPAHGHAAGDAPVPRGLLFVRRARWTRRTSPAAADLRGGHVPGRPRPGGVQDVPELFYSNILLFDNYLFFYKVIFLSYASSLQTKYAR